MVHPTPNIMRTRRSSNRAALFIAIGLLGSRAAVAQKLIQIPLVERHRLISKAVGDSFEIRVLLPPIIPGEATRFPVVYLTDTHGGFIIDDDEMRLMMLGDVPRFIAVGIGYAAAPSIMQALVIRARDLTHVVAKADVGGGFPIAGALRPSVESGGAARFLAFIRDELIPFIDAKYPTNPKDRAYWGDSLGGLFGTYVLFTKPETFNRYIIGSPSLWWADEDAIRLGEEYLKSHDDLPANVFLGVGALEESAKFRMVTNVLRTERMLRAKPLRGLTLTTRIFPDETHTTVAPMNFIRGMVSVFGPPAPEEALMAKYAAMTKVSPSSR
jgi:predicted alpha/beta superfamily hydrolase